MGQRCGRHSRGAPGRLACPFTACLHPVCRHTFGNASRRWWHRGPGDTLRNSSSVSQLPCIQFGRGSVRLAEMIGSLGGRPEPVPWPAGPVPGRPLLAHCWEEGWSHCCLPALPARSPPLCCSGVGHREVARSKGARGGLVE